MSRQYDAKQEVLKAYPNDIEAGVDLFLMILGVSAEDFRYEENMQPDEYIYVYRKQGAPYEIGDEVIRDD